MDSLGASPRSTLSNNTTHHHVHLAESGEGPGGATTRVHLSRTGSVDIFAGSPPRHHQHQPEEEKSFAASFGLPTSNNSNNSTSRVQVTSDLPVSPTKSVSHSSKAVMSALRALQDKIKRLEKERTDAIVEVGVLRGDLKNLQARTELRRREEIMNLQDRCNHLQLAYDRLVAEKDAVDDRLAESEKKRAALAHEATRLRAKVVQEEESRRTAEVRVAGVEARIGKMEQTVKARRTVSQDTIQQLEEALHAETTRRLELEERTEKFGGVLLSVLDMNQELAALVGHAKRPTNSTSKSMPPRTRTTTLLRKGGILPFLPASHHRTFNLLATLSQAVRECKQREPKQVLDALYELVQQDSGNLISRTERRAFPAASSSSASSSSSSTSAAAPALAQKEQGINASKRRNAEAEEALEQAVEEELEEVEVMLEDELRDLNRKYAGMVEIARGNHTISKKTGAFREEDLRALIEDIHRKEAELKHLRRALRRRRQLHHNQQQQQQQQQSPVSPRARSAAVRLRERLSLLSGIRDMSGLATPSK